jgi:hypothetical protein
VTEPLADRLLRDAGGRAAAGDREAALLLLGWAATISSRAAMPRVLLAWHRLCGLREDVAAPAAARPERGPLESDRLGFPVPRFATRPPALDHAGLVPVPRITPAGAGAISAERPGEGLPRASRAPLRLPIAAVVVLALAGAALAAANGAAAASRVGVGIAAMALRSGVPSAAVAVLDRVPDETPGAMVLRGRAVLAQGDTLAAAAAFRRSVRSPAATPDEIVIAARELGRLPCCVAVAADAYVAAIAQGLPAKLYPEAARQLERAGRHAEAVRLRAQAGIAQRE